MELLNLTCNAGKLSIKPFGGSCTAQMPRWFLLQPPMPYAVIYSLFFFLLLLLFSLPLSCLNSSSSSSSFSKFFFRSFFCFLLLCLFLFSKIFPFLFVVCFYSSDFSVSRGKTLMFLAQFEVLISEIYFLWFGFSSNSRDLVVSCLDFVVLTSTVGHNLFIIFYFSCCFVFFKLNFWKAIS